MDYKCHVTDIVKYVNKKTELFFDERIVQFNKHIKVIDDKTDIYDEILPIIGLRLF